MERTFRYASTQLTEAIQLADALSEKLKSIISLEANNTQDLHAIAENLYRFRMARERFFDQSIFGEPAWDMLLDLYINNRKGVKTSVKSATIASHSPASTAHRWMSVLEEFNLIERIPCSNDKRIIYLELTPMGLHKMSDFLSSLYDKYSNYYDFDIKSNFQI